MRHHAKFVELAHQTSDLAQSLPTSDLAAFPGLDSVLGLPKQGAELLRGQAQSLARKAQFCARMGRDFAILEPPALGILVVQGGHRKHRLPLSARLPDQQVVAPGALTAQDLGAFRACEFPARLLGARLECLRCLPLGQSFVRVNLTKITDSARSQKEANLAHFQVLSQ